MFVVSGRWLELIAGGGYTDAVFKRCCVYRVHRKRLNERGIRGFVSENHLRALRSRLRVPNSPCCKHEPMSSI